MRETRIYKNRLIILYSILLFSIIVFVFLITYIYLSNNYNEKGTVNINNKYYDVLINNVSIDNDSKTKVYIEDSKINIDIPDLYKYKKTNSINVELYNIGNIDAKISNIELVNFDSNINIKNVDIKLSLNKEDIIYASSKKMLKIDITYNNPNSLETDNINFDIIIRYKEITK